MKVSDLLLQRLAAWGVRRVFGFPGDGINGILGAFNRVCLATSGPGAIHLLNGLYDAKMDHAPGEG
jgi:pyruvate dehydrogenase (quinone)